MARFVIIREFPREVASFRYISASVALAGGLNAESYILHLSLISPRAAFGRGLTLLRLLNSQTAKTMAKSTNPHVLVPARYIEAKFVNLLTHHRSWKIWEEGVIHLYNSILIKKYIYTYHSKVNKNITRLEMKEKRKCFCVFGVCVL